ANDFAPGDEGNTFHLDHGGSVCAYLKWDAWPKPSAQDKLDFDLYMTETSGFPNFVGTPGVTLQNGSAPPTEKVCYANTRGSRDLDVRTPSNDVSGSTSGPGSTPRFDLFLTGDAGPLQYATAAGSIVEPAGSPDALAVGAICAQDRSLE